MHTTISYPFDNNRYIRILLKDDANKIIGSIEGVASMIFIKMEDEYRCCGHGTILVNEFRKHFLDIVDDLSLLAESDEIAEHFMESGSHKSGRSSSSEASLHSSSR